MISTWKYRRSVRKKAREKEKYILRLNERHIIIIHIKMPVTCVCCGARVDSTSRRPFNGIAMRLFVSARTSIPLPKSGWICNTCRLCYLRWRSNIEFADILNDLEKERHDTMMDTNNEVRFVKVVEASMHLIIPE